MKRLWSSFLSALLIVSCSQLVPFADASMPTSATVINDGVPGENSTELRARLPHELDRYRPRFVVIYTGMNDAVNDQKFTSLQAFMANVQSMLDAADRAHAVPVLVAIQPVDEQRLMQRHAPAVYGSRLPNQRINDHNDALVRIAKEHGVAIVRFDKDLNAAGGPNVEISPDGVHMYAAGYKLLATAVWRVIQPKWKAGDSVLCIGDSLTFGQGVRPMGEGLLNAAGKPYPTYPQALNELQLAHSRVR